MTTFQIFEIIHIETIEEQAKGACGEYTLIKTNNLTELLNDMDVPLLRKELTKPNVRWLLRNIRINNNDHPRIDEVIDMLKNINSKDIKKECPNPGCYCGACDDDK